MISCQAILFDMDGVLIDSNLMIERILKQWAAHRGIPYASIVDVHHGRSTRETVSLAAPHLDAEKEADYLDARECEDIEGIVAFPGAHRLLSQLPIDRWAIVTSASRETALQRLERVDLPMPRVLVTADDVLQGKPAPDPYLLAAGQLGIAPGRCVVVEDAPAGIAAGHAAGAQVIAVASTLPREQLADAHIILECLDDLVLVAGEGSLHLSWKGER